MSLNEAELKMPSFRMYVNVVDHCRTNLGRNWHCYALTELIKKHTS